jgi:SNF2 family DNA or RNA helicase
VTRFVIENKIEERIYALGRVTRFVIENTIEERIFKLQEKKQLVFEGHYALSHFIDHTWNASCN